MSDWQTRTPAPNWMVGETSVPASARQARGEPSRAATSGTAAPSHPDSGSSGVSATSRPNDARRDSTPTPTSSERASSNELLELEGYVTRLLAEAADGNPSASANESSRAISEKEDATDDDRGTQTFPPSRHETANAANHPNTHAASHIDSARGGTLGNGTPDNEPPEIDADDDMEAYMAEWLKRLRGESTSDETTDESQPTSETSSSDSGTGVPVASTKPSSRSEADSAKTAAMNNHADGSARVAATKRIHQPERADKIQALREVANDSARFALEKSRQHDFCRESASKGTLGIVALIMGIMLIALSPAIGSVLSVGGMACLGISVVTGLWIVRDWLALRNSRK